jgi:hypothetical protein
MRVNRRACRVLVGKPEGKRSLGKPRSRWAYNIKIYIMGIGWGVDRILSDSCVPINSVNLLSAKATVSF